MKSIIAAAFLYTASQTVNTLAKKSYDYEYSCPHGYDMNDHHSVCTKTIYAPSESGCPFEYKLSDRNKCIKFEMVPLERVKEFEDLIHRCPLGYSEYRGRRCRKEIRKPNNFLCPKGFKFEFHTKKCVKEVRFPPTKGCPEGSVEEHGKCLKKETQPLIEGGYKYEKIAVEWRCPEGLKISPSDLDRCERKRYFADPEKICESQKMQDGCGWIENKGKQLVCPSNFHLSEMRGADGGQLCEKCGNKAHKDTSGCEYKPAKRGCTAGFRNTGHSCEKIHWQDFKYVCPQGGNVDRHPDGVTKCTSIEIVDKFKYCPDGFHRQGKECVKRVPLSGSCPEGFEQFVMLCKRVIHVQFELKCSYPAELEGDVCVDEKVTDVIYGDCPSKSSRDGEFCISFDERRKERSCPPGYKTSRGKCYKLGDGKCPSGFEEIVKDGDSVCVMKSIRDVEELCPKGFHPAESGKCSRVDEIDPIKRYKKEKDPHRHGHGLFGHHR